MVRQEKERIAQGLCPVCGINPKPDDYYRCADCRQKRAQRCKYNLTKGLCRCGKEKQLGSYLCEVCKRMQRKNAQKHAASGICRCGKPAEIDKKSCKDCLSRRAGYARREQQKLRHDAIMAYGGYICNCCGETERLFLELDHIYGGGCAHRRAVGNSGSTVIRWLKQNNYPEGLMQVLCSNCNTGRARNGGICPHKSNKCENINKLDTVNR